MLLSKTTIVKQEWKKAIGGALVLLGMAGIGLPSSQAELRYNGGFVQTHRYPSPSPLRPASRRKSPPASPSTVTSYSPDNDFGYPSYNAARTSGYASYYYAVGASGRSASSPSDGSFYGVSAAALPWNQVGFKGYDEPSQMPQDSSLSSARKYSLEVTLLPQGQRAARAEAAVLIAYLPEHARFWVDDRLTRLNGPTHYFQSPALTPGQKYSYTVRVAWLEDGRWVSQTRKVPVQAGLIQAIYLRSSLARLAKEK